MEITVSEAKEMLNAIDGLAVFAALHSVHTKQIPELVKLIDILKEIITKNMAAEINLK